MTVLSPSTPLATVFGVLPTETADTPSRVTFGGIAYRITPIRRPAVAECDTTDCPHVASWMLNRVDGWPDDMYLCNTCRVSAERTGSMPTSLEEVMA